MKKPRCTEEQIAVALRQAEQGAPATQVRRKLGLGEPTFDASKKRIQKRTPIDGCSYLDYHPAI